jgi:hypothetical protein
MAGRSVIQTTRGWPGFWLRWLVCTAFYWVFLWAFMWPTGARNLATVQGTVSSYARKAGRSSMGGSPEQAIYSVRQRIGDRDYDRTVWINVDKLDAARVPELPQLVGREIDAKVGFGDEIYGLAVSGALPATWFSAEAKIAAKWANFIGALQVSGGIAFIMALLSSLDVFRRKPTV